MTNPDVNISFANPGPDECPLTFTDLVALLNTLISGEIEGEFVAYVTGVAIPAVDDQDKVWHRVDAQGRPVGTYVFYQGAWRKEYSVPVGTIAMYSGDPSIDFSGSGHKGTVGGEWDGWAICSGENGSPNLSDKFIVGAKMDDLATGYPDGGPWQTGVSGATTQQGDGVHDITLTAQNTFRPAKAALKVGIWHAGEDNGPNAQGTLFGFSGAGADRDIIDADPGNETPDAIPTLPPYYALAYVIFQGY